MSRTVKPSGGRTFSETCLVRGQEAEGRMAILRKGLKHYRIAPIGPDGLTMNGSEKIPVGDVLEGVDAGADDPTAPIPAIFGDRGTITIPSVIRRNHRLQPGSPVLIEDREEGILIRPAEIVPRRPGPTITLEGLLEGVTPDILHPEVDAGPSVGRESW